MKSVSALLLLSATSVALFSVHHTRANAAPFDPKACLASGQSDASCACRAALSAGTRSALEQFLKDYPASASACLATASTDTTPGATGGGNSSSSGSSSGGHGSSSGGSSSGGSSSGGSSSGGSSGGSSSGGGHGGSSGGCR